MKKVTVLLITILMMAVSLVGCGGNDDTIQTCIISNSSYSSQEELESANQEDALIVNEPVYASVHFVESPKGMEYTVKRYLVGTEIKTETKETEKATETTADDSSKGPGMQETVSNSGNTSGENTEKADLIGPGV